ncbi:hypothetical protein AB0L04_10310 [Streptomyces glaucescens]|uniref:hypothetical protein n=1 Tax=Streptomyces glaucescens TaxID=1907 RepID=UPI00344C7EA8
MPSTERPASDAQLAAAVEPGSTDSLATAELKSTAKWLVGASASTAAVIVAGLQLTNLDKLGKADWWLGVLAMAAALLALAAAFRVLFQAALVIGTTRPTITSLDRKDRADHGNYPEGARIDPPDDPLMRELVVARRAELLGPGRDAIGSLADDYRRAVRALTSMARVKILERTYDPKIPADAAALQGLASELERRMRDVSDAAERYEAEKSYQHLKRWLAPHAVAFLVGVLGFAWLTILYPNRIPITQTAKITSPVQVEITVPSESAAMHAGLEKACAGKVLTGVGVGGTLSAPIVVTRGESKCPARRLKDTRELIVVPMAAKSQQCCPLHWPPHSTGCEKSQK